MQSQKLLEKLDKEIDFSVIDFSAINKLLKLYINFELETDFANTIQQETKKIFVEKQKDLNNFFPPPNQNKIRPIAFNAIIHSLLKRIWDEEDFHRITRYPSEINFLHNGQEYSDAKIKPKDAQENITFLRLTSFLYPGTSFFTKTEEEQIARCADWIKKENSITKLIERIRLVGAYIQTVTFAGKILVKLSNSFAAEAKPEEQEIEEEEISNDELEKRINKFIKIITDLREVRAGYITLKPAVLKRNLQLEDRKLIMKNTSLKDYFDFLLRYKSSTLKLTNENLMSCAEIVKVSYIKSLSYKEEDTPPNSEPPPKIFVKLDYPYIVDILLFELRNIIKHSKNTLNVKEEIIQLTWKLKSDFPMIQEKNVMLVFLLLREVQKYPTRIEDRQKLLFKKISETLSVKMDEIYLVYYLIRSDYDESLLKEPLSEFVDFCIKNDVKGLLNENQVKIVRTLFGNLSPKIKANQFFSIKQYIKSKVTDPAKKKQVDILTELIHLKIRELRSNWVLKKMKEEKEKLKKQEKKDDLVLV
ncbi:MAG: hypothetical protein H7A23_11200 [Leptospiraceae bacterium]|nr:hypothetical protein [Leptospiraceae bacterium]MCP5495111.1 hypothetical protein [Leptospiraceae bacterium]